MMKLKNIDLEDVTGIRNISISDNPIVSRFNNFSQINKNNQTFDDDDFLSDLFKPFSASDLFESISNFFNPSVYTKILKI